MSRVNKKRNAAVAFAEKGDLGGSYNFLFDGFMEGAKWADSHPIGVLDEDFCWAVYNYIIEWKAGNFGEIGLQEALRKHPLTY